MQREIGINHIYDEFRYGYQPQMEQPTWGPNCGSMFVSD